MLGSRRFRTLSRYRRRSIPWHRDLLHILVRLLTAALIVSPSRSTLSIPLAQYSTTSSTSTTAIAPLRNEIRSLGSGLLDQCKVSFELLELLLVPSIERAGQFLKGFKVGDLALETGWITCCKTGGAGGGDDCFAFVQEEIVSGKPSSEDEGWKEVQRLSPFFNAFSFSCLRWAAAGLRLRSLSLAII